MKLQSLISQLKEIKVSKNLAFAFTGVVTVSSIGGYLVGTSVNQQATSNPPAVAVAVAAEDVEPQQDVEPSSLINTETDVVTGVKKHTLVIKAVTPGANSIGIREHASLVFRCKSNSIDVFISTPEFLSSNSQNIQYRWGDTPPANQWWTGGGGGTALFSEAPRSFLAKAIANNQWAISYKPYNKVNTSVLFEFDDHKKDLKLMKTLCSA